jgi:hypothetical protein
VDVTDRIDEEITLGPPEPVGAESPVDVTRFLAAAAYLDEDFRGKALSQTMQQKYRFIAPSYGVNIGCVVRHCIASRRLSRRRDLLLTALIVVGIWSLHLPLLFSVGLFALGVFVAVGLTSPGLKFRWRVVLSLVAYVAFAGFVLHPLSLLTALGAWFVVAVDKYERRYRVVARRMNSKAFNPDAPAYGREKPDQYELDKKRTAHLEGHQDGNVVVYSGFSPFIGSGHEVKRWSFAVDLQQPQQPQQPRDGLEAGLTSPIELAEVYAHVVGAMKSLDLDGLRVADRFYVSGRHVGVDPQLFFHPKKPQERFPRLRYEIEDLAALQAKPTELVRQYADIKLAIWQSELILSTFVRFSQTSHYLFVETNFFVLPPLKSNYYGINTLRPRPTGHELSRLVVESATSTPLLWVQAPLRVAKWMARPVSRRRRQRRVAHEIEANLRFDYGAKGSVREIGSDERYAK